MKHSGKEEILEVLREQSGQSQPQDIIGELLTDFERRISSGEKFFMRQEMEPELKKVPHSFQSNDYPGSSEAKGGMRTFFYFIDEVGKSDCIYRYRPLSDYYRAESGGKTLRSPETTMAFHLFAVRTQQRYYICRPGDLGIDSSTPLPAWAELLSETVKYYNEYLQNTAFPSFYHKLQPYDMQPGEAAIFRARLASFQGEDFEKVRGSHGDLPDNVPAFSESEVLHFVCNGIQPEDAAGRELADEDTISTYRARKSENAMVQKLLADPNLVSAEEKALWDAVASQPNDARTLTVIFHFRGRTESLQMKPEVIREVVLNRVSFKAADIAPSSRSDFFAMGAAPWSDGERSTLTCEHITKISYWDTVLYEKGAVPQKEKHEGAGRRASESDAEHLAEIPGERIFENHRYIIKSDSTRGQNLPAHGKEKI